MRPMELLPVPQNESVRRIRVEARRSNVARRLLRWVLGGLSHDRTDAE
jgi:hypothetical protein